MGFANLRRVTSWQFSLSVERWESPEWIRTKTSSNNLSSGTWHTSWTAFSPTSTWRHSAQWRWCPRSGPWWFIPAVVCTGGRSTVSFNSLIYASSQESCFAPSSLLLLHPDSLHHTFQSEKRKSFITVRIDCYAIHFVVIRRAIAGRENTLLSGYCVICMTDIKTTDQVLGV